MDTEKSVNGAGELSHAPDGSAGEWTCPHCEYTFPAKLQPCPECRQWDKSADAQNAGAVPRRGSDVGTSPLLAVSGSGDK